MKSWPGFLSPFAASVLALSVVTACSDPDRETTAMAAQAETALREGHLDLADLMIRRVLVSEDDVSRYWLLFARISLARGEYGNAMGAYRNVLALDRSNLEAMRNLSQLSINVDDPEAAEEYADQLLLLNSRDPLPLTLKGTIALNRGNLKGAAEYADRALASAPDDPGALALKAKSMMAGGELNAAARLVEESMAAGADRVSMLRLLAEIYHDLGDRDRYSDVYAKLAKSLPSEPRTQLTYADILYQQGQTRAAAETVLKLLATRPDDELAAYAALDLWMLQGGDAVPLETLPGYAKGKSPLIRAVLAHYALTRSQPDLARDVLGEKIIQSEVKTGNLDAKVALARLLSMTGDRAGASRLLGEVLGLDESNPQALIERGRLALANQTWPPAIRDFRSALASDRSNVRSRLLLYEALSASGETVLAMDTLREGVNRVPDDPRIAGTLARRLLADGRREDAGQVLKKLLEADILDTRVMALRQKLCPEIGPACGTIEEIKSAT